MTSPLHVLQTARATRRLLSEAPVPAGWVREAVKTQVRLASGRVRKEDGVVRVGIGAFDVAGFSTSSLAYLHHEIFVKLAYFFRASRPDPVIVDGGSNIGMSVLFFKALYPGARVLAFEPAARAYGLLARNVEANSLQGVELHQAALGRETGEVAFYEEAHDPATFRMSTRRERLPDPVESRVDQRRLSDHVDGKVDVVKLDVEGAELDVLDDLIDSHAIEQVDQLVVEYHHHLVPEEDALGAFLERLSGSGFGYQLAAAERASQRLAADPTPQDVLVYAYRKKIG